MTRPEKRVGTDAQWDHAEAIMGDIPNYTNVQPTIQISEVKI